MNQKNIRNIPDINRIAQTSMENVPSDFDFLIGGSAALGTVSLTGTTGLTGSAVSAPNNSLKSTSLSLLQAHGFRCIADDFVPIDNGITIIIANEHITLSDLRDVIRFYIRTIEIFNDKDNF